MPPESTHFFPVLRMASHGDNGHAIKESYQSAVLLVPGHDYAYETSLSLLDAGCGGIPSFAKASQLTYASKSSESLVCRW